MNEKTAQVKFVNGIWVNTCPSCKKEKIIWFNKPNEKCDMRCMVCINIERCQQKNAVYQIDEFSALKKVK